MKKYLIFLLSIFMCLSMNTIALASSDVKIKVNDEFLSDAQAILKDGSTLLPVRSVSTALGGEVVWDNATKTVSIDKDGTAVAITISKKEITVNGKKQAISTSAQIVNGRTYVPLRALGEALECDITWVNETKTVEISQMDPSEYKAWYEVDDEGKLYIKTNINSNKWNGYSIARRIIFKNGSHSWDTQSGSSGIVQYNVTSNHSYENIGTIIHQTEFYVFKGRGNNMQFWTLYEQYDNLQKAIAAMGDNFVCQINLDNRITIKELDEPIQFTDFKITYDKFNQQETYTAVLSNEIRKEGEYGLVYDGNSGSWNHGLSYIGRGKDALTFTREMHHFANPGASGTFYITYVTHSMDDKGNITVYKAESNGLDHKFPLYY